MQRFFVVVPFLNLGGQKKRVEHFSKFLQGLISQVGKSTVLVVECALEGLPFAVTNSANPLHIQLTTTSVMQRKENLINIAVSKLPPDWKYVAWVDEGTEFLDPNWAYYAMEALKKYNVVQLFDKYCITNKEGKAVCEVPGFARRYMQKALAKTDRLFANTVGESSSASSMLVKSFADTCSWKGVGDIDGQYGLAWAMNRRTWTQIGGLLEIAIAGGGDAYTAYAFIGELKMRGLIYVSDKYKRTIEKWARHAYAAIRKKVGYIRGIAQREADLEGIDDYAVKGEKILENVAYDPYKDLKKDLQGLLYYTDPKSALAVQLSEYINKTNAI